MRTFRVVSVAVLGLLLMAASPAGAAPATNPSMVNLSPSSYAIVAPVASVEVRFTCPSYSTSYSGTKDWSSYYVHFASNPLRGSEGEFVSRYEVGISQASPVPGVPNACAAFLGEPFTTTPDTYYWFVERINCDAKYCAEFSPLTSFSIVKPVPPGGSGKQPKGSTGGVKYLNTYTGCGVSKSTASSNACSSYGKMGAFFESNQPTRFKVCVKPPKGKRRCSQQNAQADSLYVTRISGSELGKFKVTWTVEGRTITRVVRRGSVSAPPKKPSLVYGKAQAEAQKSASAGCAAEAECQFWAASCARITAASYSCVSSTWSAGIAAWIRCDSESIVTATSSGVSSKYVLDSNDCYSTYD